MNAQNIVINGYGLPDMKNAVPFPRPYHKLKEISAIFCGKKCPKQLQNARITIRINLLITHLSLMYLI